MADKVIDSLANS